MTNRQSICLTTVAAIVLGLIVSPRRSEAQGYFITEAPGNYSSGGCGGDNVPDYTAPIRSGLAGLGWWGPFYQYGDAWPQDYIDPADFADTADISVFLGHGNTGRIAFSVRHNDVCCAGACSGNVSCSWGDLSCSNIRMSSGDNALVSSAVFMACCYLNTNYKPLLLDHHYEQQLMGFGGIASLDASMVYNYWNGTGPSSNVDSWLNNMEDRPNWFTGDNTTVVMSRGHTVDERAWNRWYGGLKRQNCVHGGPGGGYWYLDWHNHGCGGCTGC
jgi:hypothetical protein